MDGFFSVCVDSIIEFIEFNRYENWSKREDYKKVTERIKSIKNKYPNVRNFVEEKIVTELSKEELQAVLEIMSLEESRENIDEAEIFKLGLKETL